MAFQQITIVGTGLIGGSLALALKKRGFGGRIVGCDRAEVLENARRKGAIDGGSHDAAQAVVGSDLVVLATPIGAIIDFLDRIAPAVNPAVLITDVGSTKKEVVERARLGLGERVAKAFLPGHPMAGKELGGIAYADPDLFVEAVWLFTPMAGQKLDVGDAAELVGWVKRIGARPVEIEVERHDRLCAWVSHLPQMLATALAAGLEDEFGDDAELKAIGGRALREMTRIAASPYSMWRDIALTNTDNIAGALQRLEQRLAHLRENLKTAGLREEFEKGNRFKS